MSRRPRNVGQEILLGLRQLKRGKVGRVIIRGLMPAKTAGRVKARYR